MNNITEKALRAAILFWDDRYKEKPESREIFRLQAVEAVTELRKHGRGDGIARRNT
jgi:hypothetical protein